MTISISYHHISPRNDMGQGLIWGMICKLFYNLFIIYLTFNKQNMLFLNIVY